MQTRTVKKSSLIILVAAAVAATVLASSYSIMFIDHTNGGR